LVWNAVIIQNPMYALHRVLRHYLSFSYLLLALWFTKVPKVDSIALQWPAFQILRTWSVEERKTWDQQAFFTRRAIVKSYASSGHRDLWYRCLSVHIQSNNYAMDPGFVPTAHPRFENSEKRKQEPAFLGNYHCTYDSVFQPSLPPPVLYSTSSFEKLLFQFCDDGSRRVRALWFCSCLDLLSCFYDYAIVISVGKHFKR